MGRIDPRRSRRAAKSGKGKFGKRGVFGGRFLRIARIISYLLTKTAEDVVVFRPLACRVVLGMTAVGLGSVRGACLAGVRGEKQEDWELGVL